MGANDREELEKLRRLYELEAKASGGAPIKQEEKPGLVSRLLQSAKEMIFPWSPESQGRLLSPSPGQFGISRVAEDAGNAVGTAGVDAVKRGTEALSESPLGVKFPLTAATVGTGAQMAAEMSAPLLKPSGQAAFIGSEMAGPIVGGVLKNSARGFAKETLGMTRSQITSTKSPFESARRMEQANRVADKMLDEGAISSSGRPAPMIDTANQMFEHGQRQVEGVLKQFERYGKNVKDVAIPDSPIKLQSPNRLEPREAAELIIKKLKPKYDDELAASQLLLKDLQKHVEGGLTVREAESLVQRWGKKGYLDKTATSIEADAFRAGHQVLKARLQQHFEEVAPELAKQYKQGKEYEEAALQSLRGLYNRQASLETTSMFEPFQFVKRLAEFGSGPASKLAHYAGKTLQGPGKSLGTMAANAAGASSEALQKPLDVVKLYEAGKMSIQELRKRLSQDAGL